MVPLVAVADIPVSSYTSVSDDGLQFTTYGYTDVYTGGFTGLSANGNTGVSHCGCTLYSVQLLLQDLWLYSVQVCLHPASVYTGASASGNTVPFPPLLATQVFLQVAIQVYPLVAILYHSFHL
jgi:hypothetical protein